MVNRIKNHKHIVHLLDCSTNNEILVVDLFKRKTKISATGFKNNVNEGKRIQQNRTEQRNTRKESRNRPDGKGESRINMLAKYAVGISESINWQPRVQNS